MICTKTFTEEKKHPQFDHEVKVCNVYKAFDR